MPQAVPKLFLIALAFCTSLQRVNPELPREEHWESFTRLLGERNPKFQNCGTHSPVEFHLEYYSFITR